MRVIRITGQELVVDSAQLHCSYCLGISDVSRTAPHARVDPGPRPPAASALRNVASRPSHAALGAPDIKQPPFTFSHAPGDGDC
jgi:hypothetical protein